MCYTASTIARYFIEKSAGEKTPMQLNKLTYIAHGWSLAIYNDRLIVDAIEAWKYGPVVPVLYHEFKKYGNDKVPYIEIEETKHIKDRDKELLDKVIEVYGKYDGMQLSALTHQDGTPWHEVWHNNGRNAIISNEKIKEHYVAKAQKTSNAA